MDREQFFGKLAALDEERLKKALWNLYWRGSAAVRQRIEAELAPPADRATRTAKARVEPGQVLEEVRGFVELARSGAYLGGDRRVSPRERPRWRYTFQRLAGDVRAALHAEEVGEACEAMELLIDLACQMKGGEYFRSDDPVAAARFVVSDAVALLWHVLREEYGFAGFAQRAAAQLVRWESPYGWTRHGDGSVGDREVPLAEVLAGMLPDPDAWVGFADAYLDVLDGYPGAGEASAERSRWSVDGSARDYVRGRRASDLAVWHHLLLDRLVGGEGEDRLDRWVDHWALGGPEVVFLRARLVHQRGDLTRARELVVDGLKELPGHVELLEFAEEIGAQLPPRAAQIVAERARVTELIQGIGVDG